MSKENNDGNNRRHIVNICLQKFIEKGLYETTSRDLTDALNMTPAALYYHFKNKDDAVLKCVEEAALRLEELLLMPALESMGENNEIEEQLSKNPQEIQSMTRFIAQVCTVNKYREPMKPILKRMREREYAYCEKFAQKLGYLPQEIAPWFFAIVASSESYQIFGPEAYSSTPHDFIQAAFQLFKEKYKPQKN